MIGDSKSGVIEFGNHQNKKAVFTFNRLDYSNILLEFHLPDKTIIVKEINDFKNKKKENIQIEELMKFDQIYLIIYSFIWFNSSSQEICVLC